MAQCPNLSQDELYKLLSQLINDVAGNSVDGWNDIKGNYLKKYLAHRDADLYKILMLVSDHQWKFNNHSSAQILASISDSMLEKGQYIEALNLLDKLVELFPLQTVFKSRFVGLFSAIITSKKQLDKKIYFTALKKNIGLSKQNQHKKLNEQRILLMKSFFQYYPENYHDVISLIENNSNTFNNAMDIKYLIRVIDFHAHLNNYNAVLEFTNTLLKINSKDEIIQKSLFTLIEKALDKDLDVKLLNQYFDILLILDKNSETNRFNNLKWICAEKICLHYGNKKRIYMVTECLQRAKNNNSVNQQKNDMRKTNDILIRISQEHYSTYTKNEHKTLMHKIHQNIANYAGDDKSLLTYKHEIRHYQKTGNINGSGILLCALMNNHAGSQNTNGLLQSHINLVKNKQLKTGSIQDRINAIQFWATFFPENKTLLSLLKKNQMAYLKYMLKTRHDNHLNILDILYDYEMRFGTNTQLDKIKTEASRKYWQIDMYVQVNNARGKKRYCGDKEKLPVKIVKWNHILEKASMLHATDMLENKYFSHKSQDGRSPFDRMREQGYTYSYAGENIARGYRDVKAVVEGWLKSPGHCSNIMNDKYNEFGAGNDERYWVQNFGKSSGWSFTSR